MSQPNIHFLSVHWAKLSHLTTEQKEKNNQARKDWGYVHIYLGERDGAEVFVRGDCLNNLDMAISFSEA